MRMHYTILITLVAFTQEALAHIQLFSIQNSGDCIRQTSAGTGTRNSPIKDVQSGDMTCGKGPTKRAPQQCKVAAGQSLNFVFGRNSAQDDVIDPSHVGPCNVYLAPSSNSNAAPTKGWFKISEGVWDAQNKWCTDKLIKNKGVLGVPIPANLKAGSYVARTEINALHEANSQGGAQFYIFCAEIQVTGSGNALPSADQTVSIPGYLNSNSPGVMFNAYQGNPHDSGSKYPTLGPKIATLAVTGGSRSGTNAGADNGNSGSAGDQTAEIAENAAADQGAGNQGSGNSDAGKQGDYSDAGHQGASTVPLVPAKPPAAAASSGGSAQRCNSGSGSAKSNFNHAKAAKMWKAWKAAHA